MNEIMNQRNWVRSSDGWLAGVCEGLGKTFGIEPNIIRIIWFLSIFLFGTGLFIYLILAICLPREDMLAEAHQKKFLGVCQRISETTGLDIGLVRVATVLLGLVSFGATMVGYIVLYFVLPETDQNTIIVQ